MRLFFVEHPLYSVAHPDEGPCDGASRCGQCVIAESEGGERYLLWNSNKHHWSLSRHDPHHGGPKHIVVDELVFRAPLQVAA